ncbi:MAG: hypothetical protein R6U50_13110 [Desulfobacterales bacterium]
MPEKYNDELFLAALAMFRLSPTDHKTLTSEMICSVYEKVLEAKKRCQKGRKQDPYDNEGLSIM